MEVLIQPERCLALQPAQWDQLIPQARATALVATLGVLLEQRGLLGQLAPEVARHLSSAVKIHHKQVQSLHYELRWLLWAMRDAQQKLVLLKGGAYIAAALPAAEGRLISDIDLLVPAPALAQVEQILGRYGWTAGELDAYDDRYYRRWMHEIPPLLHEERESTLDVHHTILPPTTRADVDPAALLQRVVEVAPGVHVLAPEDMVIHSAAHLFHEGEFGHGLRDLLDLDRLLRHCAQGEEAFWSRLAQRARAMGLVAPVFYAARYARQVCATPVPEEFFRDLGRRAPGGLRLRLMDFLFRRAFLPSHPSCRLPFTGAAEFCLYLRSHYLRMPLYLLLPHLLRKLWLGYLRPSETAATGHDEEQERLRQ